MENKVKYFLYKLNHIKKDNILEYIQIKFVFISSKIDILIAKIPININVLQPFGYLHGGVTSLLSETVGSCLSWVIVENNNRKNINIFNIECSVNHIKNIKKGILFAKATILHKGETIHHIHVSINNEKKILVGFCKMTNILIENRNL